MKTKLCRCGNRRRPKHHDCLQCHRERQRRYRKKKSQQRARQEKILALLSSQDERTETQFHIRFKTDLVHVVKADGSWFSGMVVGFLPVGGVVVMDQTGAPRRAGLEQLRERTLGQVPVAQKTAAPWTPKELIDVRPNRSGLCACGAPRRKGQSNCRRCHREKQRAYRKRQWERLLGFSTTRRTRPSSA